MSRSAGEQDSTRSRGRPEGLPKRWSARRKPEVVLRLLRGEDIGEVSREIRARARPCPTAGGRKPPLRRIDPAPSCLGILRGLGTHGLAKSRGSSDPTLRSR